MIFRYDGGHVSRSKLEEAIDLYIELEPDPEDDAASDNYTNSLKLRDKEVQLAKDAIRNYAHQLESTTLESMQNEFYSIINSPKYIKHSELHRSVVFAVLEHFWSGVGEWRA